MHARPEPQWYVCGSYVLDRLFDVRVATDIDVCYLSTCRAPTHDEILAWINNHGFHKTSYNPQFIRVKQLDQPDAGDEPVFNIDYWRLESDGTICAVSPVTSAKASLTAATAPQLEIVRHPVPPDRAKKALRWMSEIGHLNNPAIKAELEKYAGVSLEGPQS